MNDKIFDILIHLLVLFTAVPVHEFAHAFVASKLGDDTPERQGRVTLNPFAHLSLWGSLMLVVAGFGWGKPVSVNPGNFKKPKRDMMLSSLAGPVSNFIMAFLSMIICKLLIYAGVYRFDSETCLWLSVAFQYICLINISLGVFNFLPIPPLDGSKIFNAVLPDRIYFKIMSVERYIALVMIVLLYSGLLDAPLEFLQIKAIRIMDFLTLWVDALAGSGI
ncbi:MAG: site-2 protease family protein [Oscillospiraceae bacterium]|nr:site-2 protease family protein [Oscillospiraceae bacterium]